MKRLKHNLKNYCATKPARPAAMGGITLFFKGSNKTNTSGLSLAATRGTHSGYGIITYPINNTSNK